MNEVFEEFYNLFSKRCDKSTLLSLGEDSLRYDFFYALTKKKNIHPSDINLEFPIHTNSFIARQNQKSYRKEKPQMDLVVDLDNLKFCAEFGMFRQNSNENGTINSTARTVKILNDMIRLAVDSFFTNRISYFICVADDTFLGHQLNTKIIGAFPSDYEITLDVIKQQLKTKTSAFDNRFLPVFENLNAHIFSKIVFDKQINSIKTNKKTKIIIWETALIKA